MLLAATASVVSAAEFASPLPGGRSGVLIIGSNETHKNLYAAGAIVRVDGKTAGDLYVAGGRVDVKSDVEQDVVMAGGNVAVEGKVGGDVRTAGGSILISGPVSGDVLAFGGNVAISDKSSVGGDLVAAGGTIDIEASVAGNVTVGGGSILINSKVSGTVKLLPSRNGKQQLVFGPNAEVSGKLIIYGTSKELAIQDGAKIPEPEYIAVKNSQFGRGAIAGAFLTALVIKFVAWFLAMLFVLRLFPRRSQEAVSGFVQKPWANLGIGFVTLIIAPLIAIIFGIAIIGYYAALLLVAWYIFMLLLSALVSALFLGAWIIRLLTKKPDLKADWQAALIGMAAVTVLGFIPVAGWLALFALFCMGFGVLLRMAHANMKTERDGNGNI